MRLIKKFLIVFLIIMIFVVPIVKTEVQASTLGITGIFNNAKDFLSAGASQGNPLSTESLNSASDTLYWVLFFIGVAVAVIIGIILGIQFVTSGVEGRAQVKDKLIPYVLGCIIVFGGFGIWSLTVNVLNSTLGDGKLETVTSSGEMVVSGPKEGQDSSYGYCTCGNALTYSKNEGIYCYDAGPRGNGNVIDEKIHLWGDKYKVKSEQIGVCACGNQLTAEKTSQSSYKVYCDKAESNASSQGSKILNSVGTDGKYHIWKLYKNWADKNVKCACGAYLIVDEKTYGGNPYCPVIGSTGNGINGHLWDSSF